MNFGDAPAVYETSDNACVRGELQGYVGAELGNSYHVMSGRRPFIKGLFEAL
jgi:hypothetical protein